MPLIWGWSRWRRRNRAGVGALDLQWTFGQLVPGVLLKALSNFLSKLSPFVFAVAQWSIGKSVVTKPLGAVLGNLCRSEDL